MKTYKLSYRDGYIPKKNCNGCGAGFTAKLVPDTIYGLNITDVCCIHDDRYEHGKNIAYKQMADREFLNNLLRKIDADTVFWRNNRFVKFLMRRRAKKYYMAVDLFGGVAFWKDKINSNNETIATK